VSPDLEQRLGMVGIDATSIDDPAAAWHALIDADQEATLFDRYEIEAAALGVRSSELSLEQRRRLGVEFFAWRFPGLELIGASSGHSVEVVSYQEKWPRVFEEWRARLAAGLEPTARRIDHVGSTAVPGLAAKPVVDIQISVDDLEHEAAYVPAIEATGVPLRSRHGEDRYFRPPPDAPRVVQIHVCAAGGKWERAHLLFRDYLRADPATKDAYGALKQRVASEYRNDRLGYTEAKTPFIREAMERAEAWAAVTGWEVSGATLSRTGRRGRRRVQGARRNRQARG
jgi:GrpB-like predicted nucleotidyltransferase (UPF0157 family)